MLYHRMYRVIQAVTYGFLHHMVLWPAICMKPSIMHAFQGRSLIAVLYTWVHGANCLLYPDAD